MPVKNKIRIKVADIVHDIRSGLAEYDIMVKYGLSSHGLQSAFRKLIDAKVITYEEICGRSPDFEDTCELVDVRRSPRNYVVFELPVVDVDDTTNRGWVCDLTEKGLKINGLKTSQGSIMRLLIMPEDVEDFEPFRLEARCRWVSDADSPRRCHSGFQITDISSKSMDELRKLIDFMTIAF